jgi:hypothetical protein
VTIRRWTTCAAAVLVLGTAAARAEGQVAVTVDNDLLGPRGPDDPPPDYEYTHGMRVSWTARERETADGGRRRVRWEVGQRIFTPRHDAPEPLPGERPYAGWLSASAAVEYARPGRTRSLGVELGVTGPPSLAGTVQNGLHRLAGYQRQLGWEHQLAFEPGIVLRYDERRAWAARGERFSAAVEPRWGAMAGNVWTLAHAGARASAGWRALPGDVTPDGSAADGGRTGVYALAGVRQEWVLRDLFLDGSTFRDGPSVGKRPFVPEAELGVGVRVRRFELRYRAVFRGREYRTQDEPHRYGSVTLTVHPSAD